MRILEHQSVKLILQNSARKLLILVNLLNTLLS